MRFLILGAGGIGGYFGGRLLQAGENVTFLLREGRAATLAHEGLRIVSPERGDAHIENPPAVLAPDLNEAFDVVIVSCKAYDLDSAVRSIAPAVGPQTIVLPLLNGMSHLDRLDQRFGEDKVLGGICHCSTTVDEAGRILHFGKPHLLVFGERNGGRSPRTEAMEAVFARCNFDGRLSEDVVQEMWEKWAFIATAAGITCLMRAAVGDILAAGGSELTQRLFDECAAVAAGAGHKPGEAISGRLASLFEEGSMLMASMLRDIEKGGRTEGEHILGDLLRRAGEQGDDPALLRIATTHLRAYEARRKRQAAAGGNALSR